METIPATEARKSIADLLRKSGRDGERIVIERRGKPVAALVPIADLERLEAAAQLDPLLPPEGTAPAEAGNRFGHWIWDEVGDGFIYCSDALPAMLGYEREAFLESYPTLQAHLAFIHPEDRDRYLEEVQEARRDKRPYVIEIRERDAAGDYRHLREFCLPVFDSSGVLVRSVGILQEITEEVRGRGVLARSEAELARMARMFRRTERLARLGHWEWDEIEDRLLFCSEELARLHGVSVETFLAHTDSTDADLAWIHPEDRHRYLTAVETMKATGQRSEAEYRLVNPDGRVVEVREVMDPVTNEQGRLVRSVGYVQDISDHKEQRDKLEENEAMLRQAAEMARLGFWVWDEIDDRCIHCSDALARINGVTPDEYLERFGTAPQLLEEVHPDDRELYRRVAVRREGPPEPYDLEFRDRAADGRYRYVRERGEPVFDANGKHIRTVGTLQDVDDYKRTEAALLDVQRTLADEVRRRTQALHRANQALREEIAERQRAQQALAESEARLKALIDHSPAEIALKDLDGRYLMVNPMAAGFYGLRESQVQGKTSREIMPTEMAELIEEQECEVRRNGRPCEREISLEQDDGLRSYRLVKFPVRDAAGQMIALGGFATDVTESRRSQAALKDSRDQLRTITDNLPVMICYVDSSERYRFLNKTALRWHGLAEQQIIGTTLAEKMGADYERIRPQVEAVLAGQRVRHEATVNYGDGRTRNVRLNFVPHRNGGSQVQGFFSLVEDLSDIWAAERAVRTRDTWLRAILDNAPTEIAIKDTEGRIMAISKNVSEILGRPIEDFMGGTTADFLPKETADIYMAADRKVLETGLPLQQEVLEEENGAPRHSLNNKFPLRDEQGQVIGICSLTSDITQMKEMQAQLHQTNKMETIGQLTGGVAHDFNNLLAVILGNADQLVRVLGEGSEPLAAILRAGERGAELTQRLLAYSRRQSLQPRSLDLGVLALDMHSLLSRTLGATIEIGMESEPALWPAMADPGQVESALLNLAINARDAMPSGGTLAIRTYNKRVGEAESARLPELAPGDYVVLEVSDSGTGMTEEVLSRATEPFFTTKPMGHGTGLGLSMIYGFASQSRGHLEIGSRPGEGATVRIFLPRAGQETRPAPKRPEPGVPPGQGETVLVVEDDSDVLQLTVTVLESLGYRALSASGAEEALACLAEAATIDLLLSDVVLSGEIDGLALAAHVAAAAPDVRILLATGYSPESLTTDGADWGDWAILRKPYGKRELAAKLRELLDGPPQRAPALEGAPG